MNHRLASYPNLAHAPVLYNILFGGQQWLHSVTDKFPAESILLFHASFGIAVANSIIFLGATLKDRKLMSLRQWLMLQSTALVGKFFIFLFFSVNFGGGNEAFLYLIDGFFLVCIYL